MKINMFSRMPRSQQCNYFNWKVRRPIWLQEVTTVLATYFDKLLLSFWSNQLQTCVVDTWHIKDFIIIIEFTEYYNYVGSAQKLTHVLCMGLNTDMQLFSPKSASKKQQEVTTFLAIYLHQLQIGFWINSKLRLGILNTLQMKS